MHWLDIGVFLLIGATAGFLNVLAGGGSLLTMPLLIFCGLPELTANGTARVAILIQNTAALWRYQRGGHIDWRLAGVLAVPTIAGVAFGATLAGHMGDAVFRDVLAIVMLGVVALIIANPGGIFSGRAAGQPRFTGRMGKCIIVAAFFGIGVYGGAVQAGVGYLFLMASAWLLGRDLVAANVLKIVLITAYMPVALGFYLYEGRVDWGYGLLLAVGQFAGAWFGAHATLTKGVPLIRKVLLIAIVLMAFKLLGGGAWIADALAQRGGGLSQ